MKALGRRGEGQIAAVLKDWRTAPVDARMRGALQYLEKLTLTPDDVGTEDVEAARAAGINDAALQEVVYVCFLFCTMDRLADALGFEVADADELKRGERILHYFGYTRMSVPG